MRGTDSGYEGDRFRLLSTGVYSRNFSPLQNHYDYEEKS